MDIKYKDKQGNEITIPHVAVYSVVKTQAARRDQFAPVALPPKPAGQGGQTEYLILSGDDLALWRRVNPASPVQKWLWGHEQSGWIAWVEPKDALRIDKANKKLPRRQRVPLWEGARYICWPAIALTGNLIYVDSIVPTKKGAYGHVVGIPADADMALLSVDEYPGWLQKPFNPQGVPVKRDEVQPVMPLMAREGRKSKAKGGLWIPVDSLELVSGEAAQYTEPPF